MDSTLALGHGPLRIERIRVLVFWLTGPSSEKQKLIRQINSSDNQIALSIDSICQYADNFNSDYDQGTVFYNLDLAWCSWSRMKKTVAQEGQLLKICPPQD